jgi:hypothetical protein
MSIYLDVEFPGRGYRGVKQTAIIFGSAVFRLDCSPFLLTDRPWDFGVFERRQ